MPKKIDLTGQRFGRLVVVGEAPAHYTSGGNKKNMWYCNCDCGTKMKAISVGDLRNGRTISCGCYNQEQVHNSRNHKTNKYDLSGSFGKGYTSKGEEFWFDLDDFDLIKDYCWYIHHKYVVTTPLIDGKKRTIPMHRLVLHYDGKLDIDHIVTERKYDNRKSNLRIVTRSQNNRNKAMQKNNSSGFPGVQYRKDRDIWRAIVYVNKKAIERTCKTFEEAVEKRKQLVEMYYDDYSYEKSQLIGVEGGL